MAAKDNKKKSTNLTRSTTVFWLPAILLFCVLPFVTYYKLYDSRLTVFEWAPSGGYGTDFYLYYKQIFFFFVTGVTLVLLAYLVFRQIKNGTFHLRKQWNMFLPLGVYFLLTLVSSIFSDYKWISFTGSDGQFESFFAIAGYMICFLYLVVFLQKEEDLDTVKKILGVLFVMLAVLSLLQITGNDPLDWEWFQRLITPSGYLESGATITGVFEENRVSLFAYNPNYAGVLLALCSAVCFGMLITETGRKKQIAELVVLLLLLVGLIGTSSKAGLLTFAVVAFCSLLFLRKKLKRLRYVFIGAAGVAVLAVILLFTVGSKLPVVLQLKALLSAEATAQNPLARMVTEEDGVHFTYHEVSFSVAFDYEDGSFDFYVTEDAASPIPLILSDNREVYYLDKAGLEDVTIRPGIIDGVIPMCSVTMNGREWMFVKLEDTENTYYFLNQYLRFEALTDIERIGFTGHEDFATYRGLIWSMTLPLLKDTVVLGTGADTFACYYPQNNYKDLYYYTGDATASSRPHSMYLKIAVESSVAALLGLLVFWGWYLVQSIRLYWNNDFSKPGARIGFACFLGVVVYLVCGLTNDSMITVAPVFWGICGIGVAANKMGKKSNPS